MEVNDPRRTDLYASTSTFLRQHGLHPRPSAYLADGYVDLCLRAWPGATGAPLHLATQWTLWTWRADGVLDQELKGASHRDISVLVAQLIDMLDETYPPAPADHPVVRALADLVERTRLTMPDWWWARYRTGVETWVLAAADKLQLFVQPGRTPTLREYQMLRPADGGMLLAAMWCELAEQVVTPDWHDPLVQSLLAAFSTIGCLTNDLAAASGDLFNAVDALAAAQGLTPALAWERVDRVLRAEVSRFRWVYFALQEFAAGTSATGTGLAVDTARFAQSLDLFREELTEWTRTSSRYVLAPPASTVGAV